jgi:hypothetical protein
MKQDILKAILAGRLSDEGADDVLDAILDSSEAPNAESLLGLSRVEWTAHGHGALWTEIARWRRHGWPSTCVACGRPIDVDRFGWRVVEIEEVSQLKHIRCPAN